MKNVKHLLMVFSFITWVLLGVGRDVAYGTLVIDDPVPPSPRTAEESNKTLAALRGILQSVETLQQKLSEKKTALQTIETEEQRAKTSSEINDITRRLEMLEADFEGIATGIDLESFTATPRTSFDWKEEIQEVLGPIIEELKRATARPREIEKLRSDVTYYEKRLPLVQSALKNIEQLRFQATNPLLKDELNELIKAWREREQQMANQLAVAQYRLDEKLSEERPLVDSMQDVLRIFFKSRGRNLLLAIVAFVTVFLLFRFMYRAVFKFSPARISQKRSFYSRLGNVVYQVLTFVGATGALLLVLYISGDWVLLGIALIFLFGIAWTAKQGLPLFWEQAKLLLNLSTIRENERVVYNGLPWKVASLNLYTKFHNPALKGGLIRLPLRELVGLHSRPFHKDEPWFPCQENDWVLLADGTFGQVLMQTPEMVQLVLLGGSHKTYRTAEFLQQKPSNLSTNFRVKVTFGIDYEHQSLSTREIPQKLQTMLARELLKEGYKEHLKNLQVAFKEAGASSLDLVILADFSGEVAKEYENLYYKLQRTAVDACNQHGWIIPFQQITVHNAG